VDHQYVSVVAIEPALSKIEQTDTVIESFSVDLSTSVCVKHALRLLSISLVVALLSGVFFSFFQVYSSDFEEDIPNPFIIEPTLLIMGLTGIILYVLALYNQRTLSTLCAHGFAVCQGIVLGGLSCYTWSIFPNIMFQSIGLTTLGLGITWTGYQNGWLKPNPFFRSIIRFLVGAICLWYMYTFIAYIFWEIEFELIYGNTWTGIAFSATIAIIACLETLLCLQDIDEYERHLQSTNFSEEMQWFFAMELMAGIIWVYIEVVIMCFKWQMKTDV